MTTGNRSRADADEVIFSATLRPHRSLGRRGVGALIAAIGALWLCTSLFMWVIGAWPVLAFVGLDFLAVCLAFWLNIRSARAFEEVAVSRGALSIRRVGASGRARELRFNPRWVRLEVRELADEGVTRIAVRAHDRRFPVGAFLNPDDRRSFARALGAALAEASR